MADTFLNRGQIEEIPANKGIFYWNAAHQSWYQLPRSPREAARKIGGEFLQQQQLKMEDAMLLLETSGGDWRDARIVVFDDATTVNYDSSQCLRIFGARVLDMYGEMVYYRPYIKMRLSVHGDQRMEMHSMMDASPADIKKGKTINEIVALIS